MTTSQCGIDLIKQFEGLSLEAYQDGNGVWTIGYGHTGPEVQRGLIITPDRAEELLRSDLIRAENAISTAVKVALTQFQFDALVSFVFNIGSGNFFSSSMLKQLNIGNFDGADSQFSRWVYVAGKPCPGLVKRRAAEAAMFATEGGA